VRADADLAGSRPDPRSTAGARVGLPVGAQAPVVVYVNGVQQTEGADYVFERDEIRFTRPLRRPRERFWHRAVQTLAGVGIYNQGDAVDVHYADGDGGLHVVTQVAVRFPSDG
jgi:hypothetical protein